MDITKDIVYLEQLVSKNSVDLVIGDTTFIILMHYTKTHDCVIVNGSYLYNKTEDDEYYTFESLEDLLDGLVKLCPNNIIQEQRKAFVKKIEECIRMYSLITNIDDYL